jgi:hypothetical protein
MTGADIIHESWSSCRTYEDGRFCCQNQTDEDRHFHTDHAIHDCDRCLANLIDARMQPPLIPLRGSEER